MTVNELKAELDKIPVERRDEPIKVYVSAGALSGIVSLEGVLKASLEPSSAITNLYLHARDSNDKV